MKKSSGYVSNKFINLMFFELGFDMELDHYETYCSRMESVLGASIQTRVTIEITSLRLLRAQENIL